MTSASPFSPPRPVALGALIGTAALLVGLLAPPAFAGDDRAVTVSSTQVVGERDSEDREERDDAEKAERKRLHDAEKAEKQKAEKKERDRSEEGDKRQKSPAPPVITSGTAQSAPAQDTKVEDKKVEDKKSETEKTQDASVAPTASLAAASTASAAATGSTRGTVAAAAQASSLASVPEQRSVVLTPRVVGCVDGLAVMQGECTVKMWTGTKAGTIKPGGSKPGAAQSAVSAPAPRATSESGQSRPQAQGWNRVPTGISRAASALPQTGAAAWLLWGALAGTTLLLGGFLVLTSARRARA